MDPVTLAIAKRDAAKRYAGKVCSAVGDSQSHESWSNGTAIAGNTRKRHYVWQDVSNIRLTFCNFANIDLIGSLGATDNITVRAGVENSDNSMTRVFFGGKRDVVIEPGGVATSDPIAIDLIAGTYIWTRTHVLITSGGHWPLSNVSSAGGTISAFGEGCDATGTTDLGDFTISGSIAANTAGSYQPWYITGIAAAGYKPTVGLVGDSIVSGVGDHTGSGSNTNAGRGFARRALNNTVPYIAISVGGEKAVDTKMLREVAIFSHCSYVISNYGINDIKNSQTDTTVRTRLVALWKRYSKRGIKVYQCTITPETTSTDSWATVGNQTIKVAQQNTYRIAVNNWIRDGSPVNASLVPVAVGTVTAGTLRAGQSGHPLVGYFETADQVESARDSGLWKAGYAYVTDGLGLHPTPAGHAAMATAVNPAVFV